jgi:hypothetical protein
VEGHPDALARSRTYRNRRTFQQDAMVHQIGAMRELREIYSRFITGTEIIVDGGMTARCD